MTGARQPTNSAIWKHIPRDRNQYAARSFDDEPAILRPVGQTQILGIDCYAVQFSRAMRRQRLT